MLAIDLLVMGIIAEQKTSAYDIAKRVERSNKNMWTDVSVSSVYKKVLSLAEKGFIDNAAEESTVGARTLYEITPSGREYLVKLTSDAACADIAFPLEFNLAIANLKHLDGETARKTLRNLRKNLYKARSNNAQNLADKNGLPFAERAIYEQLESLYRAMIVWLTKFENEFYKLNN